MVYCQDFHGQLPEPSCDRLFDFDFEKRASGDDSEMSEAEVNNGFYIALFAIVNFVA
jgi:hypothetical protein